MTKSAAFKVWDLAAIAQRQEMLTSLARKVWDMPNKNDSLASSNPVPQTAVEVKQ